MAIAVEQVIKYSAAVDPDKFFLKLTFSGSYPAGGDTFSLAGSSWTDPNVIGLIGSPLTPPTVPPSVFDVQYTGAAGSGAGAVGSTCDVVPGTTLATYKLQQFIPAGSELSAGAYPAGITNGYVIIEVVI